MDSFEIIAKAPGDASPTQVQAREMLRSLLEERFKLIVHREAKEGPIYALMVEKNAPKLKKSTVPVPSLADRRAVVRECALLGINM